MVEAYILTHCPDNNLHELWAYDPKTKKSQMHSIDDASVIAALKSGFKATSIGSYLLLHADQPSPEHFVDFMLYEVIGGATLKFDLIQQGSWYWSKFTSGYPYTPAPGAPAVAKVSLTGITGYVLSRINIPGRSGYELFNFDAHNDTPGGSSDPISSPMGVSDGFPTISGDDVLIPALNYVIAINHKNSSWRVFSFDPQLDNPLSAPAICNGTHKFAEGRQFMMIGDELIAWTPGEAEFDIHEFKPSNPFKKSRKGKFPKGFSTAEVKTLTALHPRTAIGSDAEVPGTMDFMRNKIEHIVYYVVESRSFDGVLGWLHKQGTNDINWVGAPADSKFRGASEQNSNHDHNGNKWTQYKPSVAESPYKVDQPTKDPYHGTSDAIRQQWRDGYEGYSAQAEADMSGFVNNNGSKEVMAAYTPEQLKVLNGLGASYAVSDDWFCSEAGGTTTNRASMASGSAYNITASYEGGAAYANFPQTPHRQSMWKVMANHGVMDWCIYHSVLWENKPYTYHLFLEGQLPSVDEYSGQRAQPVESFLQAARTGKLPKFSFVEPVWVDPNGSFTSYHPSGDMLPGEQALKNIVDALSSNKEAWEKTVLVVSFSKGGGNYDHVPARRLTKAWPNDQNDFYEFDVTGTRVPTIVVSPLVKEKTVFRSVTKVPYDATSLAATVLSWLGIDRSLWGMGDRIHEAPTFESVFQLANARQDKPELSVAQDEEFPTPGLEIPVAAPAPMDRTWGGSEKYTSWTSYHSWKELKAPLSADYKRMPTQTATFGESSKQGAIVDFAFGDPQVVNQITFSEEAPAYEFRFLEQSPILPCLSITGTDTPGTGVTNYSNKPQTFNVQASSQKTTQVQLAFFNYAGAGDSTIEYQVGPSTEYAQSGGIIAFNQFSSAQSAHFKVTVGALPTQGGTVGAEVRFLHNSTADKATFDIWGSTGPDSDTFGNVVFHNQSNAGKAIFHNQGATTGDGGNTQFYENTSAKNATIHNYGATEETTSGGDVAFDGTATADHARITNHGGPKGYGGVTSFNNNRPFMAPTIGASAGFSEIVNKAVAAKETGTGGHTEFTGIYGAATAADAKITNEGSSEGTDHSVKRSGYTLFAVNGLWPYARPSAGSATIINQAAQGKDGQPGNTHFTFQNYNQYQTADKQKPGPTAGKAKIQNLGGTTAGALGGLTTFDSRAGAGSSKITIKKGSNGGHGGRVQFADHADGEDATVHLEGGTFELSGSQREALSLHTLKVTGGTLVYKIKEKTTFILVGESFSKGKDPVLFSFYVEGEPPSKGIKILEAESLKKYSEKDFVAEFNGKPCKFTIDQSSNMPALIVQFPIS